MSGFRGGRSSFNANRRGRGYGYGVDQPLVKLVEDYLLKFKHLSFINLEHMGEFIRKQNFRYSRLRPAVFQEELRKAYEQYSANASRNMEEFSGGDLEMDNTPLTDDMLKQMEGYPSDSDSDLEIDESAVITVQKDAGVNQMKNLYTTPATSSKQTMEGGSKQDQKGPDTGRNAQASKDKSDCISVGSSTDASVKSDMARSNSAIPQSTPARNDTTNKDDDSESDLEIIEEVQQVPIDRLYPSVITNTNGYGYPLTPSKQQATTSKDLPTSTSTPSVPLQPQINSANGKYPARNSDEIPNSSRAGARAVTTSAPPTKKPEAALSRGVKRKAATSLENDIGINDDLTRKKSKKEVMVIRDTGYKLQDFAGSEKVVEEICKLLMHLKHPEVYQTLGVTPPRGFLLHGPPGTGKTLLANAIAGELQTPMLKVAGTELVSGISGESESNIRELFNQAVAIAPCIVFIDEIDSVTPRRDQVNKEMERRIVAQLLACIDELGTKEKGDQVLLIGATNRIEAIDTALRRAGRFDREICLGIPDEKSREKILSVICRNLKLEQGFDLSMLAKFTPGYVGADLQALVREAAVQAVNRKLLAGNPTKNQERTIDSEGDLLIDTSAESTEMQTSCVESSNGGHKIEQEQQLSAEATSKEMKQDMLPEQTSMEVDQEEIPKESSNHEIKAEKLSENSQETEEEKLTKGTTDASQASEEKKIDETPVLEQETPASTSAKKDGDPEAKSSELNENAKSETKSEVEPGNKSETKSENASEAKEELDNIDHTVDESHNPVIVDQAIKLKVDPPVATMELQDYHVDPFKWITEVSPLNEEELSDLFVTMQDFKYALKNVQPSSKREGFATVPDTTWEDIGALQDIRDELQVSILGPVKHADAFKKLGLTTPAGVLLCGPPGCGKTLLAKAVANEAGINFISVKGPELLNMYVGESERAIRQCFLRARNSSPCVIFFDELDALCPRRSDVADSGSGGRIVNQLLTEMDGIEARQGVFVMAASNRPDIIDPAVLRPGRLDKVLFVNLPAAKDRFEILKAITKNSTKPTLADDVNLEEIASYPQCNDYTGADLSALVREASIAAFRELVLNAKGNDSVELKVHQRHFEVAFTKTKPSVGKEDRRKYQMMAEKYSTNR